MTATPQAPPAPAASVITLPDQYRACLSCGVAVAPLPSGSPATVLTAESYGRDGTYTPQSAVARPARFEFARCADCAALADQARGLIAAHPQVAGRHGGPGAVHRLTLALEALSALGESRRTGESQAEINRGDIDASLDALLRHLAVPGGNARWLARFAPFMAADAAPGTAALAPWSHLSDDQRKWLRAGWAQVLRERAARAAPPVMLAPPPLSPVLPHGTVPIPGGCLLCGLAAVEVPAEWAVSEGDWAAAQVWRPITVPHRASRLTGHLCPEDQRVWDLPAVGSFGPTLAETSYLGYLDALGTPAAQETARTLRAKIIDGRSLPPLPWGIAYAEALRERRDPPAAGVRRWTHLI